MRCFDASAVRHWAAISAHQRPALEFFTGYQQLLRIATQRTTQNPHHVDIQGVFAPKHSLREAHPMSDVPHLRSRKIPELA
jgi:hypothetical protein